MPKQIKSGLINGKLASLSNQSDNTIESLMSFFWHPEKMSVPLDQIHIKGIESGNQSFGLAADGLSTGLLDNFNFLSPTENSSINNQTPSETPVSENTRVPVSDVSSEDSKYQLQEPWVRFQLSYQDHQPYKLYSSQDTTTFVHPTSDKTVLFHESAADNDFANAASLPEETVIPNLEYYPYLNDLASPLNLSDDPLDVVDRLIARPIAFTINPNLENEIHIPLANPDVNTVIENYQISASANVLPNDLQNGGGSLTVENPGFYPGTLGNLFLNSDGTYTYTLNDPSAFSSTQEALTHQGPHDEIFNYTVINSEGGISSSTLTIHVLSPPVAEINRYSNEFGIDAEVSQTPEGSYSQFNPNNFPLTQEGVNISTILQQSNNPQTDNTNDYLVNNITMEGNENALSVTFMNEGAGYQNTVGWYQIDPTTGEISNVKLIWANSSAVGSGGTLIPGQSTEILGDVTQGEKIGFFLVANGFQANFGGNQDTWNTLMNDINNGKAHLVFTTGDALDPAATITDPSPHLWYVPDSEGALNYEPFELISVTNSHTGIYHTAADPNNNYSLDADGLQHAVGSLISSGPNSAALQIGFEDLYGTTSQGSDRDLNDIIFRLNLPVNTVNYQQADSGHVNVDFTDADGLYLTKAVVDIAQGGIGGDKLVLQGFTLSSTADADGYYHITNTNLFIKGLNTDLTGTNEIDIKGLDTHAQYQDVINHLHLQNDLSLTSPDMAAGTRTISVQVYDENNIMSNLDPLPYIITHLTAENATEGTSGNDYLHLTNPALHNIALNGNGGDDIIQVSNAHITLNGGTGNDQLIATGGANSLHGDDGNDTLYATGGNNSLYGGAGNDFMDAGSGSNILMGGGGQDVFHFSLANVNTGINIISDFAQVGVIDSDTLDLSQLLQTAAYTPGLSNINEFVQIKEASSGLATLSVDMDGPSGGGGFIPIAVLTGIHAASHDVISVFDGNYHLSVTVVPA